MQDEIEKIMQDISDWSEEDIKTLYREIGSYLQEIEEDANR